MIKSWKVGITYQNEDIANLGLQNGYWVLTQKISQKKNEIYVIIYVCRLKPVKITLLWSTKYDMLKNVSTAFAQRK